MKRPAAARTDIAMDGQTEGLKLRMHKSHKTYFFSFESKRFPPCIHTHLDDLGLEHNSIIEGTNTNHTNSSNELSNEIIKFHQLLLNIYIRISHA